MNVYIHHYLGHMKLEIPFRKSSLSGSMLVVEVVLSQLVP